METIQSEKIILIEVQNEIYPGLEKIFLNVIKDAGFPDEVALPEKVQLRQWAGIIKYADVFLGCDSVGQHLAYAVGTPANVVLGATYPENTSYPDVENFNISVDKNTKLLLIEIPV